MDIDSATPSAQAQASQTSNTSLPNDFSQWLNPLADLPFQPWPSEESIRRGALASIQVLLDQGVDPATFDPEKGAELEAERKRIMDEEDRIRDEERARLEDERRREMERRMSVSGPIGGERREEMPKVFQLETFDDDDED
jgi:predicted Zn-dependent peptidase